MKRIIPLILFAALCAADEPKSLWTETRELIKNLRDYSVHTPTEKVHAKIPPALEFLEAHTNDTANHKLIAEVELTVVRTSSRAHDYVIADAVARRLAVDKSVSVDWRLDAATYLAQGHIVASNDYDSADAIYASYTTLRPPAISPAELARAYALRAGLFTRRNDFAGATNIMAKARAEAPGDEKFNTAFLLAVDSETVGIYKAFYYMREAYDYCLAHGRRTMAYDIASSGELGDMSVALSLARELVVDPSVSIEKRQGIWFWLFPRDRETTDKLYPAILGETTASTNSFLKTMGNRFSSAWLESVFGRWFPSYYGNYEEVVKMWGMYLPLLRSLGRVPDFKPAQYATVAFAATGDLKGAVEAAKAGLENKSLGTVDKYELELAARTLLLRGSQDSIASAIAKADRDIASTNLTDGARLSRLNRVGSMAVASRNDALARGFASYASKISRLPQKRRYVAKFSSTPVLGAGTWDNLPFKPEEQPLSRKFGGKDLSFMTTDVATGERIKADADAGASAATLQAVTDDWGVHLLLTFRTELAREYEAGVRSAGNYECYIAPGANQPYTCFMCNPVKDSTANIYSTSYEGPGHRRVDSSDPTRMRSGTYFTDNAVLNYIGFSWECFPTLIPVNGAEWDLECVFWGPVQCAWNGTESIHGRSTWGILSFELTDADRAKIFRKLIFRASRMYRYEKTSGTPVKDCPQGGVFDYWKDKALGDPVFYEKVLKPLEERLDKGVERVKFDMTDDDVRDIAEHYLKDWIDIRYTVGRLRAAYLKERLSEE